MALEHALVQKSRKIEMDEKSNFQQKYKNVIKRANFACYFVKEKC